MGRKVTFAYELQKSCNLGHDVSQYNYAIMCRDGKGEPEDLQEAIKYCKQAAEQGYPDAKHQYMNLIQDIELGPQEREYFQNEANNGDMEAQYNYAQMCRDGEGGHKIFMKPFYILKKPRLKDIRKRNMFVP